VGHDAGVVFEGCCEPDGAVPGKEKRERCELSGALVERRGDTYKYPGDTVLLATMLAREVILTSVWNDGRASHFS